MNERDLPEQLRDLSVQVAATQLLLRSLISCLLVEDDQESNRAIDKLLNSISRRAALGKSNALAQSVGANESTRQLIQELEKAIRTEAVKLVADLRRSEGKAPS